MEKLSGTDKIRGFKLESVDKFLYQRVLDYTVENLVLVDCDREL